jgi:hypothetical protein
MEPSASDVAKQAWAAAGAKLWPVNPPIQVLSPARTVGLGRTNISFEGAYARLKTDATTPYASFAHPAAVYVNFEPIAYGITSAETYVITFNIRSSKAAFTLSHSGDPPLSWNFVTSGGLLTVQAILRNNSPTLANAILASKGLAGAPAVPWTWYFSVIKFADPIVNPPI